MGGGGRDQLIAALKPDVFSPTAPIRTSPDAMPDFQGKPLMDSGIQETEAERLKRQQGSSRLVIPLSEQSQAGGYTAPRNPQGVV